MEAIPQTILELEKGINTLPLHDLYKKRTVENIKQWLTREEFHEYVPQICYLIEQKRWELLLDSFYQTIPFGTGGRRGPVGIGTNRINLWTIQASAQGHSAYLLKKYPDTKKRGIVIAYDVRTYPETGIYSSTLPNPVKGMTSKDLAWAAAAVYTANDIPVFMFDDIRTTPELSFAIRHLHTAAGIMLSASHNPKEDNGKKVYAADGGQLIPPEDQELADTVISVAEIKKESKQKLITMIGNDVDAAYISAVKNCSRYPEEHAVKILYTPLHGVGGTSIFRALQHAGFSVLEDAATKTPDGSFPHVKFNIANPEVPESFETCIKNPDAKECDIIFASDPDADRLGLSVSHKGQWVYLNGNEIGIVLVSFLLETEKERKRISPETVVAKTLVTTGLINKICAEYNVRLIDHLLVGFKYIGNEMLQLERKKQESNFLVGLEESHGYIVGTYCRDKDAAGAALVLAECASRLKKQGKTIVDYLNEIYKKYGVAENYLTSLIMNGAVGIEKIQQLQNELRKNPLQKIGTWNVKNYTDYWQGSTHLSETDTMSRNVLVFELEPDTAGVEAIKITVRPSGTEPKSKIYIEVLGKEKKELKRVCRAVKNAFLQRAYALLGIELPVRGFLLSDLLSVEVKKEYFVLEKKMIQIKNTHDERKIHKEEYQKGITELLAIFGKDPVEKINACFEEEYKIPFRTYFEC